MKTSHMRLGDSAALLPVITEDSSEHSPQAQGGSQEVLLQLLTNLTRQVFLLMDSPSVGWS